MVILQFFADAGDDASGSSEKRPCARNLDWKEDGDALSIVAYVYYRGCGGELSDELVAQHTGQLIGNYMARLNEILVLAEMRRFGLQPYTIKIVNAQLPRPTSEPTVSKVPSLEIAVAPGGPSKLQIGCAQSVVASGEGNWC